MLFLESTKISLVFFSSSFSRLFARMFYQASCILILLIVYSYAVPIEQDYSSIINDRDFTIHLQSALILCRMRGLCNDDDERVQQKRLSSKLFHGIPKFGKRAFSSAFAGIPKFG